MKRKKRITKWINIILIIIIIHAIIHITLFGTNISTYHSNISGLLIEKNNFDEGIKDTYPFYPLSGILIFIEWLSLISLIIFALISNKIEMKKEFSSIKTFAPKNEKKTTDIDELYHMLKKKKRLKISIISKYFKIEKNLAREWAKILESAGMVKIIKPKLSEEEVEII